MRLIVPILLFASLAGCINSEPAAETMPQDSEPGPGATDPDPGNPVTIFDEVIELGPSLGEGSKWTFLVPNGTTVLELDMVELEGATAGEFKFAVVDPLSNETVMLDGQGIRYGTSGYMSGYQQNGRFWKAPVAGEWTIQVESEGRFQQHVIIRAMLPSGTSSSGAGFMEARA